MGLAVLGIGTYFPPQKEVKELIRNAGGDPTKYNGWKHICVSGAEEHPSTMGEVVLRKAISQAGIGPEELNLVISTGSTFDYLPSWSVSNELMQRIKSPPSCLGFDLSQGCVACLTALDIAESWLSNHNPNGYAAIVCAQRWAYAIDRSDPKIAAIWGWGDGAAAIIVSRSDSTKAKNQLLNYLGSAFASRSEMHGSIMKLYGGTRAPTPPAGQNPFATEMNSKHSPMKFFKIYQEAYEEVIGKAGKMYGQKPNWVICNHISEGVCETVAKLAGVEPGQLVHRGQDVGHVSSADVPIDLENLIQLKKLQPGQSIFAVSSGQHSFACGVFTVPR